jgi:hypothetical protein
VEKEHPLAHVLTPTGRLRLQLSVRGGWSRRANHGRWCAGWPERTECGLLGEDFIRNVDESAGRGARLLGTAARRHPRPTRASPRWTASSRRCAQRASRPGTVHDTRVGLRTASAVWPVWTIMARRRPTPASQQDMQAVAQPSPVGFQTHSARRSQVRLRPPTRFSRAAPVARCPIKALRDGNSRVVRHRTWWLGEVRPPGERVAAARLLPDARREETNDISLEPNRLRSESKHSRCGARAHGIAVGSARPEA